MEEKVNNDITLVKQCIKCILDVINDMYLIYAEATRINDIEIRHSIMRNLTEEIYGMMTFERTIDRAIDTVLERNVEVYHAEEI